MNNNLKTLKDLSRLKNITTARIGLERAGSSIATQHMLNFDLDHARARDAVHLPFEAEEIETRLHSRKIESIKVESAAADRTTYLQRPDLGRQLNDASRQVLKNLASSGNIGFDLCIVIADGLSTSAIHINAIGFLDVFLHRAYVCDLSCAPVIIASNARVAIADEVGEILKTRVSVILIGERPGLSASDSMGIYLTYSPQKGRTDADKNCISNIRESGLTYIEAARQLESLIQASLKQGLSGVHLKTIDRLNSLE